MKEQDSDQFKTLAEQEAADLIRHETEMKEWEEKGYYTMPDGERSDKNVIKPKTGLGAGPKKYVPPGKK